MTTMRSLPLQCIGICFLLSIPSSTFAGCRGPPSLEANGLKSSFSAALASHKIKIDQPLIKTEKVGIPGPHQVMLKMRDGVELHTVWGLPGSGNETYPVVIDRSPYGEFGTELIADIFLLFGFASIEQDFRGTCQSHGTFDLWRKSYNDTQDTIEWVVKQPWSNGEVYIVGGSADGISALVLGSQPPIKELQKQFIIWATAAPYLDVFPGGAYRYQLMHTWLRRYITESNYTLLENQAFEHESPADLWWDAVTPDPKVKQVPTVFWAGWYDIFLNGNIAAYELWREATDGKAWLVIDPLGHCQEAWAEFPHAGIEGRVALGALLGISLFKGELDAPNASVPENVKKISFFVMGANHSGAAGNHWTTLNDWPKATNTDLFFHDGHKLEIVPEILPEASVTFDYDPTNPVKSLGGNNLEMACGPLEQNPVEDRKDVLLYTSEKLEEPLAVVGKLTATLYVSSANVNDTDWTVKLTDVYPNGASKLIQDGIIRMRWRKLTLKPVAIEHGVIEKVEVSLWSTAYVFDVGHRLRVAVSSSNSPRFDPNPNTGLPLAMRDSKTVVARNTLHTSSLHPSHITLPKVSLHDLPVHIIV